MSRRSLPLLQRRAPSYPGMRDGSFADRAEAPTSSPPPTPGWLVFQSVSSAPPHALAPTSPMFPAASDSSPRRLDEMDRSVTGWAVREPVGPCVTAAPAEPADAEVRAAATPPPHAPPRVAWMLALALSVIAAGAAAGLLLVPRALHRPTAPAAEARASTVPAHVGTAAALAPPLPSPVAATDSLRSPAPRAPVATTAPAEATGRVALPARARGHRVYVDGKVAAASGGAIELACGPHAVRVGSRGKSVAVEVPCGGVATLR